jgi:hypothetical protein
MVTYGVRVNRKKLDKETSVADMYSVWTGHRERSILVPNKGIQHYIDKTGLDNAFVRETDNFLQIWIEPRKLEAVKSPSYGGNSNYCNGIFRKDFYYVSNGKVESFKTLCDFCKDKVKGIVEECKEKNSWNDSYQESCYYSLSVPETTMDLSKMRHIGNGLITKESPFCFNHSLESLVFKIDTIKQNLQQFRDRYQCGKLKKTKLVKYCSKCIFQCENRMIKTSNVRNKCCLTYKQAVKNGFFKDIKIVHGTSIYRNGIMIKNGTHYDALQRWNSSIIGKENKYNNFGKEDAK